MANIAHSRLTSVKMTSSPGRFGPLGRQVRRGPSRRSSARLLALTTTHVERLAVVVVVVADQHVVEDAALRRW